MPLQQPAAQPRTHASSLAPCELSFQLLVECIQDWAFAGWPTSAAACRQLDQRLLDSLKRQDFRFNVGDLGPRSLSDFRARGLRIDPQGQQLLDLLQGEAKLL